MNMKGFFHKKETKEKRRLYLSFVAVLALAAGILIGVVGANLYWGHKETEEIEKTEDTTGARKDYVDCITLGEYKGRTVSLGVTEDDLQNAVSSVLDEYTTYKQVKKGKASQGDMLYASYELYCAGERVQQLCGENFVEIGVGEWPAGFEEAFVGMQPGETKKISLTIPEGFFGDGAVDGRKVEYKIKLIYICGEAIVPQYDDEFVSSISDCKTVEEYNERLKAELREDNEDSKEEFAWSEALEDCTVEEYPEELMETAREENLQDYYNMAELYGQSPEEIFQMVGCANEEEFKETQLEELAKDSVKEILFANAVAYDEKLEYTETEYQKLVQEEYEYYKSSYSSKEDFERKNENRLKNGALIATAKRFVSEHTTYTE